MRIGVAALGKLSEDTGGRNYIDHFFSTLARSDHGHDFVLFVSEGERKRLLPIVGQTSVIEIPNTRKTSMHKVIGEQLFLRFYIRQHKIELMYFPGNFATFRSPVPYVVNIRGMAHYYGAKYGVDLSRRLIRKAIMPFSAKNAAAIITPSNDIKRDAVRFLGVSESRIHVIPHGVDTSLFSPMHNDSPEARPILRRFDLKTESYFLYVSALWRYKNHDKLIEAFARYKRASESKLKLVIVGRGSSTEQVYVTKLHALPNQLGIGNDVIFTDALPQEDLKYLYANALAFLFPSSYESFGNPIFEAWASGLAVATSDRHSFPEMVADAGSFFDPDKPEEIIETMRKLENDAVLRRSLAEKGMARAREFTWEQCLRRTLSVLESVRLP